MNKVEELQMKIDYLQKELNELKEQEKESDGVWRPKRGERYWYINECGDVFYTINAFNQTDEKRFLVGNVFKTREEAEFAVEKLKVLTELKVFAEPKDRNRNWNGKTQHWSIGYGYVNQDDNIISVEFSLSYKTNSIYFESKEKAQQAVDAIGKDRIKKYYLEVE